MHVCACVCVYHGYCNDVLLTQPGHSDVVMGALVVNDDKLEARLRFLQNGKDAYIFNLLSDVQY